MVLYYVVFKGYLMTVLGESPFYRCEELELGLQKLVRTRPAEAFVCVLNATVF